MEQKEISKLTTWNNLYKEFGQSILRMVALVDFIEHCMEPEDKPVVLNNPINYYGNIEMEKAETLPLVTSALTEEKKKAMELARQMKALLDEADFETWNCVAVSKKRRAAVEKWKETMKDEAGGIRATFDRQPGGLVERFRKEAKEVREAAERGDYKAPAGLGPVRVLTAVNDKIVENVNGRTVERIKIMFPCEATDEEKDFIRQSVIKYTDEILNGDPCECAWKVLADDLKEEWMAKYRNRYSERHTGISITPYEGGTKVVAYMVV